MSLFQAIQCAVKGLTGLRRAKQEENRQWQIESVPFKTEVLSGWYV